MSDSNETTIRIALPLPMDVVGNLMKAISDRWPDAVAKADAEHPNTLNVILRGPMVGDEEETEEVEDDGYRWPFSEVRPELELGNLCAQNGNVFAVRAICKQAIKDCDELSDQGKVKFLEEFLARIRPLDYGVAMDFIREVFDWIDDDWYDDPRFSAKAKAAGLPVPA